MHPIPSALTSKIDNFVAFKKVSKPNLNLQCQFRVCKELRACQFCQYREFYAYL
jgi:hypothetical protein